MSLVIIPASAAREVTQLISLIYGATGTGKTTLAISSHLPLLLDCEDGENRAIGRCDMVEVKEWDDCAAIPTDQLLPYKTIIVDTVGALLTTLFRHLLDGDRKMGTRAGAPTQKGYQAIGAAFRLWLARLKAHGLDVVLLAHAKEEQQGDDTKIRPNIMGQSRQLVFGESHLIGLLALDPENKRILDFNPSFYHHGKNPPQYPPMEIPNWTHDAPGTTMADLLADAKVKMSRQGTEPAPAAAPAAPSPPAPSPSPQAPATAPGAPETPPRDDGALTKVNDKLTAFLAYNAPPEEKQKLWEQLIAAAREMGFEYDESISSFIHADTAKALGVT